MAAKSLATLLADVEDRYSHRDNAEQILLANSPATEREVGKIIYELLTMYESFERRTEASKTVVVNQWRKSLGEWPVDVLEAAAQAWVNGEKASYVPQPGDVLKTCERIGAFRRAMARKAFDFMEMAK